MKKALLVQLATLGPVGNFKGPGTLATFLTLPLVYAISALQLDLVTQALLLFIIMLVSLWIVSKACKAFPGSHDPSAIVIDEVIGCLVAFYAVPLYWYMVLIGFILFRILDIFKPFGIGWLERFTGSWGIVFDDILAGILTNITLHMILLLI